MFAPPAAALLAAGMFILTPVIADGRSSVMVDVVVAALALEATYWLATFFATDDRRHAALFGLFAAFCCMTKGDGVLIVFVPVLLMLLTGRVDVLRRPGSLSGSWDRGRSRRSFSRAQLLPAIGDRRLCSVNGHGCAQAHCLLRRPPGHAADARSVDPCGRRLVGEIRPKTDACGTAARFKWRPPSPHWPAPCSSSM